LTADTIRASICVLETQLPEPNNTGGWGASRCMCVCQHGHALRGPI